MHPNQKLIDEIARRIVERITEDIPQKKQDDVKSKDDKKKNDDKKKSILRSRGTIRPRRTVATVDIIGV